MPSFTRPLAVTGTAIVLLAAVPAVAEAEPGPLRVVGTASVGGAGGAYTYDVAQLPVGARVRVGVTYPQSGSTVVTLHVHGALPSREYGAHAHVAPCGAAGTDAGGHFQFVPGGSPTDPAYANPENEVWLDFTTDAEGNGSAQTVVPWQPEDRRPMSVVIHASHTSTSPGSAGTAGSRLGCLSVPF